MSASLSKTRKFSCHHLHFTSADTARSDPWDYTHKFDYIHTRTTAGCWENFETQIAQQAFDSLNPGGWFESQEFNSIVGCDDDTLKPGMALTNWFHEIAVASEICRRPTVFSNTLVEVYKRVGFVDVEERVLKMPMNGWPKDPQLKEIGRMWEHNFMQGLSGFSLSLFNRAYGRTAEETEVSITLGPEDVKLMQDRFCWSVCGERCAIRASMPLCQYG